MKTFCATGRATSARKRTSDLRPAKSPTTIPTIRDKRMRMMAAADGATGSGLSASRSRLRRFPDARAFGHGSRLKSGANGQRTASQERSSDYYRLIQTSLATAVEGNGRLRSDLGPTVASHLRQYRSFTQGTPHSCAGWGLKSVSEWRDDCKSGREAADIPANPDRDICE